MEPTTRDPDPTSSPVALAHAIAAPRSDLSYWDAFWTTRAYEDRCDRVRFERCWQPTAATRSTWARGFGRLINEFHRFDAVLVPTSVLVALEPPLQGPLGRVTPGPSVFVRAIKVVPATIEGER